MDAASHSLIYHRNCPDCGMRRSFRGAFRGLRGQIALKLLARATSVNIRNSVYILPAVVYSGCLLGCYVLYGITTDYLPAVLYLGAVCILAIVGWRRKIGKYWISIVSIMLSYEALQGVVGSLAETRSIISLYPVDKLLWGFNVTGWVQSVFASSAMTLLMSIFYSLHFPLIVATCLILWYVKRPLFGKYVTAMILTSYAALVTFLLAPTAPPWYTGVATNLYQGALAANLPQGFSSFLSLVEVDQFAAFPSLHGAYAIIFSYFLIKVDRRLALISVPITVGILFSTLYLGQHYLIDLLGGALYALVPCLVAEKFQLRIPGSKAMVSARSDSGLQRT